MLSKFDENVFGDTVIVKVNKEFYQLISIVYSLGNLNGRCLFLFVHPLYELFVSYILPSQASTVSLFLPLYMFMLKQVFHYDCLSSFIAGN